MEAGVTELYSHHLCVYEDKATTLTLAVKCMVVATKLMLKMLDVAVILDIVSGGNGGGGEGDGRECAVVVVVVMVGEPAKPQEFSQGFKRTPRG